MRDGDDLDALAEHAIHNKESKAAQQNAPRASNIRSAGLRPLRNQLNSPIELATKPYRRSLVPLAVPPLGCLCLLGGE